MRNLLLVYGLFLVSVVQAQKNTSVNTVNKPSTLSKQTTLTVQRPKLVVGIVVDQMRWDYLYKFLPRFEKGGGFVRLLQQGFSNENTFIPYKPTVTACGHTSVYTGSVPAIHGITGNAWWDYDRQRSVYCTEDKSVQTVGSTNNAGEMSPRNMLTTTICDELKLATQFRSKVIGIAIKDRGGILPAGHSADAAYWYDSRTGNWITSTYYMKDLPDWVKQFNARKWPDHYYAMGWSTLYPIDTYVQSDRDENDYEGKPFGADAKGFPYDFTKFIGKNYSAIATTPYGNTLTVQLAQEAIVHEQMGKDSITDFLAVSFSSPDYIGHAFGPNSIEIEDNYLRLDKDLGRFFDFLDQQVGKNQYLVFLTSDHGVAHVPGFLKEHKIPAGSLDDNRLLADINQRLKEIYGIEKLALSNYNYQISLDRDKIDSADLDKEDIMNDVIKIVTKVKGVDRAFAIDELMEQPMSSVVKDRLANGYHPRRSGDVQIILQPAWIDGGETGTTHGLWNPYDSHIPLLWYGWGIKPGRSTEEVYMTDIAATLAAMLRIQMPNGCVGKPIQALMK